MSRIKRNNPSNEEEDNQSKKSNGGINKTILIIVMGLVGFIWAGGVYSYDFPQLFEQILITKFKVNTLDIGLLYTMASAPTIVLIPLASWLISFVGLGYAAILFNAIEFFGVFICYLGNYYGEFLLIIVGRALFGLGYETCYVVQSSCTEKWFSGKFLSMAFAVNRIISYSFSSFAAYIEPQLFVQYRNLETPLFLYALVLAFGTIVSFFYYLFDKKHAHKLEEDEEEGPGENYKFKLSDLKKISSQVWLMLILFGILSNCLYQFTNIGTDCLVNRFGLEYLKAKDLMAIIPLCNIVFIPVFSAIISAIGAKGLFLTGSALIISLNYLFLSTLGEENDSKVIFGIIGVSIFFSLLVSSYWSSLSLLLPKQAVPVIFGLCISIQNIFLAAFPPLFSVVDEERTPEAYQHCFYLLIGISGLCFLMALFITIRDLKGDKTMHLPENSEKVKKLREKLNKEFMKVQDTPEDKFKTVRSSHFTEEKLMDDVEEENISKI